MQQPILSTDQLSAMFKVSPERIKQQYAVNAQVIKKQLDKVIKTGKKVDGYTAAELLTNYNRYVALSK